MKQPGFTLLKILIYKGRKDCKLVKCNLSKLFALKKLTYSQCREPHPIKKEDLHTTMEKVNKRLKRYTFLNTEVLPVKRKNIKFVKVEERIL